MPGSDKKKSKKTGGAKGEAGAVISTSTILRHLDSRRGRKGPMVANVYLEILQLIRDLPISKPILVIACPANARPMSNSTSDLRTCCATRTSLATPPLIDMDAN